MKLGTEVDLLPGHIVLDGDPAPTKGHSPLNFRYMSVVAKRLDKSRCHLVTWYTGRPRPRPHCVRWGPSSPKKTQPLIFGSAHACCDQTAELINVPLGTEVDLCPGHIVLDGWIKMAFDLAWR